MGDLQRVGVSLRSVNHIFFILIYRSTHFLVIGDIFRIRVLKQDIIVINSEKIARDLLDRRSRIYADRPYLASRVPCVVALPGLTHST